MAPGPDGSGAACSAAGGEGGEDDALLLAGMGGRVALAGAGALGPADVAERDPLRKQAPEAAGHDLPGAHVPRLLLAPDDLLQVRVAGDQRRQLVPRERVEELDPCHRNRLGALAVVVVVDVVEDLAAAQDEALDRVLASLGAGVVDDQLELAVGQVLE